MCRKSGYARGSGAASAASRPLVPRREPRFAAGAASIILSIILTIVLNLLRR
ncbi:MAG TPA: hypothetical protein VGD06_13220 [Acidobacteriota bacterium]